jgi:hypothetical protein
LGNMIKKPVLWLRLAAIVSDLNQDVLSSFNSFLLFKFKPIGHCSTVSTLFHNIYDQIGSWL